MGHVLVNTVQELSYDGRFHPDNQAWANRHYVPEDAEHNACFVVRSHPAVVDGFISEYRKLVLELGLFERKHCEPDSGSLDYTGKVLVLSPNTLSEEFWSPQNQLWLAESGFGCSPDSRGRKVFGQFLKDGEKTHYQRSDIVGILKDEYLPEWAKEKLDELAPLNEDESEGMTMGGM